MAAQQPSPNQCICWTLLRAPVHPLPSFIHLAPWTGPPPPHSSPCFDTKICPPLTKYCSPCNSDDTKVLHPSLSLPHCSDPKHRITVSMLEWCRTVATHPTLVRSSSHAPLYSLLPMDCCLASLPIFPSCRRFPNLPPATARPLPPLNATDFSLNHCLTAARPTR
jgi:hypothetical protein